MKNTLFLIGCYVLPLLLLAQKRQVTEANESYDNYAYVEAIKIFEKVAEKGYKSVELFEKLANSYYYSGNLEKACQWYTELYAMKKDLPKEVFYKYAQSLKSIGKYEKANVIMQQFSAISVLDSRAIAFRNNVDYIEDIKKKSRKFTLEQLSINSEFSDYGATLWNDQLIFTTTRETNDLFTKKTKWDNQANSNLYAAVKLGNFEFKSPEKWVGKINTPFNESSPAFSPDGKTVYFTRNNEIKKEKNRKVINLKIFRADYTNGNWENSIVLPFNDDNYSNAHPTVSPDGKYLYFTSNRPGGFGETDLYRVAILSNGTYGIPENLGEKINTEARESFPYISKDNTLYFSSTGHLGLGGLDIFAVAIHSDGTFMEVENLGMPVNSAKDDFAFSIDSATQKGFLSSNREGGLGYDDIYGILEEKTVPIIIDLSGVVVDEFSNEPVEGVKIRVYNAAMELVKEVYLLNGNFSIELETPQEYYIRAEAKDFETKEISIVAEGRILQPITIQLRKNKQLLKDGLDLAKLLDIPIIYFDTDKFDIREDAMLQLEKVYQVLLENPKMKIDIRSHTDSRQTDAYNLLLSDKRAKATRAYFIEKGIDSKRISAKGYGEAQPVNECVDAIPCTEEQHQENRRSEFIIIQ